MMFDTQKKRKQSKKLARAGEKRTKYVHPLCASISQENKGNKEDDEVSQTWTCNQEIIESENINS